MGADCRVGNAAALGAGEAGDRVVPGVVSADADPHDRRREGDDSAGGDSSAVVCRR